MDTISRVVLKYDIELEFNGSGDKKTRTKTVEMGDEVDYEFKVTNTGGVKDTIWIFVGNPPSGWDKSLTGDKLKGSISQFYVELDQNEDADLTLTLQAPSSGGDMTTNIDITAQSKGSFDQGDDPIVSDKINAIKPPNKAIIALVKLKRRAFFLLNPPYKRIPKSPISCGNS